MHEELGYSSIFEERRFDGLVFTVSWGHESHIKLHFGVVHVFQQNCSVYYGIVYGTNVFRNLL